EDTPALASNYISALFEDRKGRIWAGTDAGDLSWFDGSAFTAIPRESTLRGEVAGFAESPGGDLFVAFRGVGLRRLERERLVPVRDREGRPVGRLGVLARGPGGEIWGGGEGRLFRFANGAWSQLELPQASGRLVTALAVRADGELLLSEDDLAVRRVRPRGLSLAVEAPGWQLPHPVRTLAVDRDRTLWIGMENGLARLREAPGSAIDLFSAGPASSVNALAEDREGGLWIATGSEGLLRLRADEAIPFGVPEGLPHDNVWNVFMASDGALWATTSGGLTRILEGRAERVSFDGVPDEDAISLGERRDGSLWVGTFRNGLFRLPRAGAPRLHFTVADGLPPGPLTVVFEDSRGMLWIGSREGLARESGGRFQPLSLVGGDVQPYVAAIAEDREGTVWIATNAGLFAKRPDGLWRYGPADGLASTALNALLIDREGHLWIATNGQGIQVFDQGRFLSVDRSRGLPASTVLWIVEDDRGGLWLSTISQGLFRANRKALLRAARGFEARVEARRFGFGDGLRDEECVGTGQPAGTRTRDGRIWFPTSSGLISVDPARLEPPTPPSAVFEAFRVDGRPAPLPRTAALDLPPGRGDVEIHFSALGLDEAAGTAFRYRLHGYDPGWIEAGTRRSAFYTRLAPGTYRFEVQALHDDGGPWSPPAALAFDLRPHLYEKAWFRGLGVLAAGLLLYSGVRWRSRRLEHRIAQRTAELHRALEVKGAFLATMSHELRTPLTSVLGFSNLLLDSALDSRQREFTEIIHKSGENLLSLVNQILDLSQSDQGKLTLAAAPFWVPDCFEEAVDLVAPAAAAKGLDLALAIETTSFRLAIGDHTRVREIATNLLANAVKFTETGGVLATARASLEEGRLAVVLTISDTGIGIAEEHLSRIFEPFEQIDTALARRYGGAGLGLAIASRLCTWMQGDLSVESVEGKGSTFTATIRLDPDPAPAGISEVPRLEGRHVLLAGLSGPTREAAERQLRSWGATVSTDASRNNHSFAFGLTAEPGPLPPGMPWIRLVSPAARPEPGASPELDLLRPLRPSRLAAAVQRALGAPRPDRTTQVPVKAPPATSPAILVVEDDPVSSHLIQTILRSLGYASDAARNGEEALAALETRRYDLLLLDIQMPGMDGFELARRVRARFGDGPRPRLIALTAAAMERDRERCLAAGMDDYLSKPMRREQLAAVIKASAGA
ncbi:MAG TPA: two-component regulator propeller domain-containing protein, partial [Thermoanaerobaculia bacterium]|nr:two-component regulator propeller domain-containing protein [Thermoanaerobaculia bacterium]